MAKSKGPLFSVEAHGTIGDVLTFSKRKSGQQVRFQRKQKDVISVLRTTQRAKFLLALDLWRALPDNEKNYWNEIEKHNFIEL